MLSEKYRHYHGSSNTSQMLATVFKSSPSCSSSTASVVFSPPSSSLSRTQMKGSPLAAAGLLGLLRGLLETFACTPPSCCSGMAVLLALLESSLIQRFLRLDREEAEPELDWPLLYFNQCLLREDIRRLSMKIFYELFPLQFLNISLSLTGGRGATIQTGCCVVSCIT